MLGKNYEYKKAWVLKLLHELAGVIAIEICAYTVMKRWAANLSVLVKHDKG